MVNNNEKQLADLEQKLDNYKKIEREFKENAEKKIKEGLTLDSKAIVDLNQARERISELETKIIEIDQNRDQWNFLYKGRQIEIDSLNRQLENQKEAKDAEITDLTAALESEVNENNERKGEIISLNKEITKIRTELDQANLEIKKQIQQKRLGNLFAAGVFITEYLPIPEKWQTSIKTGFNTAQAWQIAADIPQATYEVIIGFTAILVFLGTKGIFYRIFGRKEINKIAELRGELQDALRQKSKFEAEIKELKETKITPEILPEEEKPAQSKNSKVKSPKKNKKKK